MTRPRTACLSTWRQCSRRMRRSARESVSMGCIRARSDMPFLRRQQTRRSSPNTARSNSASIGPFQTKSPVNVPGLFDARSPLSSEAAERASYVAFAKPLECAVAQLAHTLTRDTEHGADLLECMLSSGFETEVETEHLRVTWRKCRECRLDLVVEEAVHRLFLGVGHLVGDEALDERAIAFRIHGRVEAHVSGVQRCQRLHDVDRKPGELRELFGRWLATHLLPENLGSLDDAREICGSVERNTDGPSLPRERAQDRLANPPHRVGDEFHSLVGVELPGSSEQADVAFTDQVDEGQAAVLVFLRDGNDEAQVALHQLLECILVSSTDLTGNLDLLVALEQRVGAYLIEVLIEDVALGLAWRDSGRGRLAAAFDFSHWGTPQGPSAMIPFIRRGVVDAVYIDRHRATKNLR